MEFRNKISKRNSQPLATNILTGKFHPWRSKAFAVSFFLLLGVVCAPFTEALDKPKYSANDAVLAKLEQWLFFIKFSSEPDENRVTRLEKRVFGEAANGPLGDRINRINDILSEQKKREAEEKAALSVQQEQTIKPKVENKTPPPQNTSPYANNEDSARLAVQAAREQEIKDLLAEGTNLWRAKRGPDALERFEQALRLDSQNAEAHFSMGIIQESSGNYVAAANCYKRAAECAPNVVDYKKAAFDIEKKLQTRPQQTNNSPDRRRLLENATMAFKRGEYASAMDLYKQLDEKYPEQASTKYSLGTIYLMLKDHYNALDYYKQAHKLEPSEPRYAKAYKELSAEIKKNQNENKIDNAEQNNPKQKLNTAKRTYSDPGQQRQVAGFQTSAVAPVARNIAGSGFGTPGQIPINNSMPRAGSPVAGQNSYPAPMTSRQPQRQDPLSQCGISGKSTRDGVIVNGIVIGSRAASSGLIPGDYIRALEGNEITDTDQLNQVLMQYQPSQKLQMMIIRNGDISVINF